MTTFLELLLGGLSMGSVYALIALGFVVIFKATEVVNFAHASSSSPAATSPRSCTTTSASGRPSRWASPRPPPSARPWSTW